MRKALAIIGFSLMLAALVPFAVEAAGPPGMAPSRGQSGQWGQRGPGGQSGQWGQHGQWGQWGQHGQFNHGHGFQNWRWNRYRSRYPYYPYYSSYYYVPPTYYAPYNYSDMSSGYGAAPGYGYGGYAGGYSMPLAPQIEREVIFPQGRYVLLGDGVTEPFRWVWVPNPPTAPPSEEQD
jgi:hypothetical protein